jgi:hypothetical protein
MIKFHIHVPHSLIHRKLFALTPQWGEKSRKHLIEIKKGKAVTNTLVVIAFLVAVGYFSNKINNNK